MIQGKTTGRLISKSQYAANLLSSVAPMNESTLIESTIDSHSVDWREPYSSLRCYPPLADLDSTVTSDVRKCTLRC